ncbi:pre-mrna splicing factor clf1 [Trichoderma cornu-damae]|uniref:Pre-mrna splicing factor clf1 n=1 Tax=Trichoderma cornu-damae TaxID=654480 RepID=A0A9P8QXF5_9HYPO|nr:pre-mrna splicing factor clf1 [Trichoderma cornu-damae]
MSLPKPPSSLDNSCSVIHGNTLYSYSPQGFLSLPLEESAQWKKLDMGVKVTGATCVGTNPVNAANAALFLVGGTTDAADYTGLQKFTFSTGNWTTITPSVPVTQNRLHHGSTYIQADDTILVYAGSQDGSAGPSTQTFTIQASEPYAALSFQSNGAAPAISPIVMSWSSADAAMMSGDGVDGKIYWFNPTAGWRYSGASLSQPINMASGSVSAVLISGDDGSKNLYTFDMSRSPNAVSRTVVQDAAGNPIPYSAPVAARGLDDDVARGSEKRELTLSNWPQYNSTLAPTATRQNFAVAQAPDGTVVFTGGNAQVPLAIFNADKNGWADAASLLGDKTVSAADASSTTTGTKTTSSSRPTSTTHSASTTHSGSTTASFPASATQTAASSITDLSVPTIPTGSSGESADSGPSPNAILGITLGSIAGFLALLGLILLLLRCRRRQQLHPETGKPKAPPVDEKSAAAFTQTTFAKGTLPPQVQKQLRGHQHTVSSESTSSMTILVGRVGQHKPRKLSNDAAKSTTTHKQLKGSISKPILQPQQAPILRIQDEKGDTFEPPATELRPQDGLARADDGTRRSSGWNKYWSGGSALNILGYGAAQSSAQASEQASAQASAQRNTVASDRSSHYSQTTRNIRATQDSATVPNLNFEGPPGMSRVNTGSPVVSSYPNIAWQEGMSGKIERPISAVSALSASSGYSSGVPESIQETWDPTHAGKPWGADRAPSSAYAPSVTSAQLHPLGVSKQPQLTTASTSNDMSWLNLGDSSRA